MNPEIGQYLITRGTLRDPGLQNTRKIKIFAEVQKKLSKDLDNETDLKKIYFLLFKELAENSVYKSDPSRSGTFWSYWIRSQIQELFSAWIPSRES
jgi:hypothetical protein